MSKEQHDKQHSNTAYRWGVVVGQPNLKHWTWTSSQPNMSNVGLWVRAHPDHDFRTHDGTQIICFNSEEAAATWAEGISHSSWNYEAKLIPHEKPHAD